MDVLNNKVHTSASLKLLFLLFCSAKWEEVMTKGGMKIEEGESGRVRCSERGFSYQMRDLKEERGPAHNLFL